LQISLFKTQGYGDALSQRFTLGKTTRLTPCKEATPKESWLLQIGMVSSMRGWWGNPLAYSTSFSIFEAHCQILYSFGYSLAKSVRNIPEQESQIFLGSVPFTKISLIFPGQEGPTNIPDRGQT